MTRMRFVLADPEKADVAKIEALKSVKGTFTQAGQFQVIIGNDVSVFYNEFTSDVYKRQLPVPGGYDTNGNITTDPAEIEKTWRVLPMGYWKGSGISIALDLIATVLKMCIRDR